MHDESPSREIEKIARERYWPMILGFAAVAVAVVGIVLLIAHRLATGSGNSHDSTPQTVLVVVTGTPQATLTPYPTYTPYPKTHPTPYPTYTPLPVQATPTGSPILTLGQLTISMPYNGNYEYCSAGVWPNPITLQNTGTSTIQWFASLPKHYSLTPMQTGTLSAGASLSLTITGPVYSQPQMMITFSANGARQSVNIPCVSNNG